MKCWVNASPAASGIGADQDPASLPGVQLLQGQLGDGDVVGRGGRPGVARSQDPSQRRAGPTRAVVGERQDRMEAEAKIVIRCRKCLLGVRGNERRIKINNESVADFGQRPPGRSPAAALAYARAAAIPVVAVPRSLARAPEIRETVRSDATFPNTCGRDRSITTSAGQSPPAASITARSQIA